MNTRLNKLLAPAVLLTALLMPACADDEDDGDEAAKAPEAVRYQVPLDVTYINTGVEMGPGKKVIIESSADALGFELIEDRQQVLSLGRGGLIGRIGENGQNFAIGEYKELQGNSENIGKTLYLGRNDLAGAGLQPTIPALEGVAPDEASIPAFDQNLIYSPGMLVAYVTVKPTDAPGPLTPEDGFFSSDSNPTFNWDDIAGVIQYTVQVSQFPDFRSLLYEMAVLGVSNLNFSNLLVNPLNPINSEQAGFDDEAVYYWRVNAEYNASRSLASDLVWTEHSVTMSFGFDLFDTGPEAASILRPKPNTADDPYQASIDDRITIEFFAPLHPGGSEWRYSIYSGSCQETLNADNATPDYIGPWRVYLHTLDGPMPYEPPGHYDYIITDPVDTGAYIYRIESKSVYDREAENLSDPTDFYFSVNCN